MFLINILVNQLVFVNVRITSMSLQITCQDIPIVDLDVEVTVTSGIFHSYLCTRFYLSRPLGDANMFLINILVYHLVFVNVRITSVITNHMSGYTDRGPRRGGY